MTLFSLQDDDEWFDSAPADVADVSLSQVATALYTTPLDTFNMPYSTVWSRSYDLTDYKGNQTVLGSI